ncbi:carbamoyltransferase HypF [Pseudomonas fluorescens]|uniref:carbamoyltransferase HypF n=1 Tax=Pseudomonas fluorescens TaxID=294 RepID=UPI001CD4FCFA|nr:carbamoyltransferase HypF [Pseudomonas fluorescens]
MIRVRGLVQGVGFRPTVWRLARDCGLYGDVCNDAEGVLIRIWGTRADREQFLKRLREEAPPLSRIDSLESMALSGQSPLSDFRIVKSSGGRVHTGIVADAATCAACLREVFDPVNRRYRYAFTNCTHCGPRMSIVRAIPYDRGTTSMGAFTLCPACLREYRDPADRRFHAQPNACPVCGPRLWLEAASGSAVDCSGDPLKATRRLLKAGHIVAIKGIGGVHLACDASNASAVARLRQRKRREHKPFALMARDTAMIRRYCSLDPAQTALLQEPAAPIVLLPIEGPERLADGVAPRQCCYGFMLPYSPLHHLLMAGLQAPIVLTSGNRSEEPQCIGNDEARERLGDIADALLLNDREIVNRLDDSVARLVDDSPALLRRARGYAPTPLRLPASFGAAPAVLALGGELKNSFCLIKDGQAILSQHLGDLANASANAAYRQTLALYQQLFEFQPQVLAIDCHPDYLPSKFGREWAAEKGLKLVEVQHHHAHIAACLADNAVELDSPPVLGIALDGTGYGDDASLWGAEFLLADYHGYRRLASLATVAMPGGEVAIEQPWRMAYAHLRRVAQWSVLIKQFGDLPYFQMLADKPLATLDGMLATGFNSPLCSSCGRLFDAVAAVIGLCQQVSYEGQAAIELEAAVDASALADHPGYPFAIVSDDGLPRLEPQPMWQALLTDLHTGVARGVIAARFHLGLAQAVVQMIEHLTQLHGDLWSGRIALSGGVLQNAVLTRELIQRLEFRGLQVLRQARVPANDGGLSLGQAAVATAQTLAAQEERQPCA